MKLLSAIPDKLSTRGHPDSVAVQCDCGVTMLWERSKGTTVRCPSCRKTEDIPDIATATPKGP